MDLMGRPVLVVGLARSGIAAATHLARRGARVVATDRRQPGELSAEALNLPAHGVSLELGGHRETSFVETSLVVVSPGVPWDLPELQAARQAGVAVIAELELGFGQQSGVVAAVTGTKGKSTTTAALGAMLREEGKDVRVGGNIGDALTGLLEGATRETVFALEVSSFQLEGTDRFRPKVAVFLNLSPDHLDRHRDLEDYTRSKARIFQNQTEEDWAVVNGDDPTVLELGQRGRARLLRFHPYAAETQAARPGGGDVAFFSSGLARLTLRGEMETLFPLSSVSLPGRHLAGDLLAAAAAARLLGVSPAAVARAVAGFSGVEHVLERVRELNGVAFFNDSKATNVEAVRHSLAAFQGPLLVIMGGRHKGGDFADLQGEVASRVKTVFTMGEARDLVAQALCPVTTTVRCASLREAVSRAFAAAEPGDTVLLAPGCSSFDMFEDYADRGRAFKAEVRRLVQGSLPGPTGDAERLGAAKDGGAHSLG
jgi:UDP-N-acetylmuramoylalanine--D-glutamate ligase